MTIDFISPKNDNDNKRVMHSKSDKIEIMVDDKVIKELFISLQNRYQNNLEKKDGR